MALTQSFFIGLLISFVGQLPMGNMNMIATQLSVQEGIKYAWRFGLGVAIIEVVYLRIALSGMDWVVANAILFQVLAWGTVIFFLVLGVVTLVAAKRQPASSKGVMLENKVHRFLLGVSLSAINPLQIPFWFTWIITLVNNGLLPTGYGNYNSFTVGAGLGTLLGIAVYIHGGKWALQKTGTKNKTLNYILGFIFILAALIQLYRNLDAPWEIKHQP